MKDKTFYLSLSIVTVILALGAGYVHNFESIGHHLGFSIVGLAVLVVYNIMAFHIGKILVKSSRKNLFINFIMGNILFKIILVMLFILGYVKLFVPEEKLFLLPFVGIYLVYAAFETFFLYQMVNLKQNKNEQI